MDNQSLSSDSSQKIIRAGPPALIRRKDKWQDTSIYATGELRIKWLECKTELYKALL